MTCHQQTILKRRKNESGCETAEHQNYQTTHVHDALCKAAGVDTHSLDTVVHLCAALHFVME